MRAATRNTRAHIFKLYIRSTEGFLEDIPEDVQDRMLEFAFQNITIRRDFIVFRPEAVLTHIEDGGITIVTHIDGLTKKCYAKLDDFQEPSKWNEIYEKSTVETLEKCRIGRFVLTFMLAEEY
jgi:hypothetical protein